MTRTARWHARLGIVVAIVVAACPEPGEPPAPPEPKGPPPPDHATPIGPEPDPTETHATGEIQRNDSLSTALARVEVTAVDVDRLARGLDGVFDVRHCRPGHTFEVWHGPGGALTRFRYLAGPDEVYFAYRTKDDRFEAFRAPLDVETSTTTVACRVDVSLYLAMEAVGEEPWLTLTLVDIFAWDVDFFTETRRGDTFRVVVEKRSLDGQPVGYGDVLAAEYTLSEPGTSFRAYRYAHESGKVGYYREDGTAVEKAFLKSPIKFATITSRYGLRRHPILKYRRAHRGVDYGAPRGTAIWSVGDGVVTYAGRKGGYGRVVYIRHANSLQTRYAHLRGYGRGIRAGKRVFQKQVIGYVGSSGLATGPHLHFEVLRGGRHVNPLSVVVPPAPPIPEAERGRFLDAVAPIVKLLDEAEVPEPPVAAADVEPAPDGQRQGE